MSQRRGHEHTRLQRGLNSKGDLMKFALGYIECEGKWQQYKDGEDNDVGDLLDASGKVNKCWWLHDERWVTVVVCLMGRCMNVSWFMWDGWRMTFDAWRKVDKCILMRDGMWVTVVRWVREAEYWISVFQCEREWGEMLLEVWEQTEDNCWIREEGYV